MNLSISTKTLKGWLREVASLVGLVVSIGNLAHLPTNTNAVLLALSGWLQVVQHKVDKGVTPPTAPGA